MSTSIFSSLASRAALRGSGALLGCLGLLSASACDHWHDYGDPDVSVGPAETGLSGDFTTVASDPNASSTLAITSSTLYWIDRGNITDTVQALSFSDGFAQQLYAASPDPTAALEDLAVDDHNVYVTQLELNGGAFTSQLVAIPQDGSQPVTLVSGNDSFVDLSVSGGYVYYSDGATLFRVPTTGGNVETVAGSGTEGILDATLGSLCTNDGAVYWTELDGGALLGPPVNTALKTLASTKGKPKTVTQFSGSGAPLLAADSSNLFWVATNDDDVSFVVAAPSGGTETQVLTSTPGSIVGLIADEANVYVLVASTDEQSETLLEIPVGGGDAVTLVTGIEETAQGDPRHALAQDDSNVYFAQAGSVLSAAK